MSSSVRGLLPNWVRNNLCIISHPMKTRKRRIRSKNLCKEDGINEKDNYFKIQVLFLKKRPLVRINARPSDLLMNNLEESKKETR
jgi:hypothetical protein